MKHISKLLFIGVLVASLGLLTACNTVNGFGRDVSSTGHAISRAS